MLKMESEEFWVILVILEGAVRIVYPGGSAIKEGVAAY